jgi:Phage integrase family
VRVVGVWYSTSATVSCTLGAQGRFWGARAQARWYLATEAALSAESREALRRADLTFHDLRHEAGGRLLEAGWPLHNISHMLGHSNIAQTSTYLNATRIGLQESMRKLDEARGCKPVAKSSDIDRAPICNDEPENTPQQLVN